MNPVSGQNVTWSPTSDGQTTDASVLSDSVGIAETQWILRTQSGADTLATSAGAASTQFTANVLPDIADSISIFSGNNTTTFAGGGRVLRAQVFDQYNNAVPDVTVRFAPTSRVSNPITTTNASGISSSTYTAPANLDSSTAIAFIESPADTARFKIFAVRYIANSLSPDVAEPGDTLNFYVHVSNPGIDSVFLDTSQTTLSFSDGTYITTAQLDSPLFLIPRTAPVTLRFAGAILDSAFSMGNYTPEMTFSATSGGDPVTGTLSANVGEFSVQPISIRSIAIIGLPGNTISAGDTIPTVQMLVQNNSPYTIRTLTDSLIISPAENFVRIPSVTNPDSILPGEQATFRYAVVIPVGALGAYSIDGYISGITVPGNNFVFDNESAQTDSFTVVSGANITLVSFTPTTVSTGQSVGFDVVLNNSGAANVLLNQSQTTFEFGGQTFNLDGNQVISSTSNSTLQFTDAAVSLGVGTYEGTLILAGTENGASFRDTLLTGAADSLVVQSSGILTLASLTLSDTVVSQGESGQTVSLSVTNTGTAAARITSADSIMWSYNSVYTLNLSSGQSFPLTISGGDTSTLIYTVTVSATAPTGSDTLRARVAYEDVNSGVDSSASDAGVYAAWDVQSRSRLLVTAVRNSAGRVSQGQNNLAVEIDIENTGAVAAVVTTSDSVGLQFLNNNGNTVTLSTPFLPDTVSGLSTQTYTFTVDISPTAATGIDSMRGFVIGRNVRSGAVTSSTGSYGAGWQVQTPPSIVINSIFNTLSQVNSGQEDLLVEMRLRNAGGATAVIDSVGLFTTPSGFITDSLVAALDSLLGGLRDTVVFDVDVSALFTGSLDIDGFVRYRDGNDTTRAFVDSFAVNTHRWQVGTEGALVVDSVYTNVPTLSLGQGGVLVNAVVRNGGDAAVRVDSLRLTFDGLVNHPVMSGVRTSPVLPSVLNAGQSFVSSFNISAASAPRDSGYITLDMQAFGTDQITSVFVSTLGAAQTDSVLLQTPADVRVVSITNPASVTQGEDNILDTLIVRNFGTASAQVNNVLLDFQRGNTWYNRELLSPVTFPVMLAGGGVDTVIYEVDVLSSAPLGVDSLRGRVQYVELNRSLSVRDTSSYLSSWQVFGSGGINVLSVQSAFDSVSTGQDSIFVQVRVGNSGNNSVIVDSLRLAMIRGLYVDSTLILTPGTVLDSASTALYDFYVTIDSLSPTGIEILNARVYGRDSFDNSDVSDVNSDTTDTWLIQRAVTLAMIAVSPVEVSQGQVISPQVRLRNTGDARLVVDTSQTRLQVGGVPRSLTDVLLLAGNSLDTLVFATDSVLSAPGLYPYQLRVVGVENGSSYDRVFTLTDLLVESAGALVIDSLVASADTVTQSMDTLVTVYVSNTGEADVFVDSVTVSPYGEPLSLNPAIPFSLAGGSSQGFISRVNIPALADTGQITMTARTQGRDANSGLTVLDTTESVSANWVVLSSPLIAVDSLYSDSVVVLGQSGILLNVRLVNSGQTPVEITSLTINDRIGLYAHRSPSLPVILGGNSSVTLVDTISVAANSATGSDTLTASVAFTNTISGDTQNFTSPTQWIWTIESSSLIDIVSVTTSPVFVSQGQNAIPVRLRLRNAGFAQTRIDSLFLEYTSGNFNYTIGAPIPAIPAVINAGASLDFNYLVNITPAANLGPDTINARGYFTEISTNRRDSLFNALSTDEWTVQQRPAAIIDSVRITPSLAGVGQNNLIGSLYLRNPSAPFRATARIDSVDLNFLIDAANADTNFSIRKLATPVLPFTLSPGQSSVVNFDVDINIDALDTIYTIDGYAEFTDINDGTGFSIPSALLADTLDVRAVSGLLITDLSIVPDTVSQGQDSIVTTVIFRNTDNSPLRIESSTLNFAPGNNEFQRFLLNNRSTPFMLEGNATDTLEYFVIGSSNVLGDISVTAIISGLDSISQTSVSDTAQTLLHVQTPAAPAWAGSTQPATLDIGDTVQFVISVVNTGETRIDLDSTRTSLILENTPIIIFLSDTSDQTISGPGDTTILVFRPTEITGIPSGVDYGIEVNLAGSASGSNFSRTFQAGQVSVGGQVFFGPAAINPSIALQGQDSILVTFQLGNNGIPLGIDTSGTTLIFRDESATEVLVPSLTRIDTLTLLQTIPNNTFRYIFNVPADFSTGAIDIQARVSLDGGNLIRLSIQDYITFNVLSAGNAAYVDNSITGNLVVPGQTTLLTLALADSGTSDIILNPDSTYLEIDFPVPQRTYLSGNYILPAQDTSTVTFEPLLIPGSVTPGAYEITLHVEGRQENNDIYLTDLVLSDSMFVQNPGILTLASLTLSDTVVSQGESGQTVSLSVTNTGTAAARITSADSIMWSYNSVYTLNLSSGQSFPLTISGGDTSTLIYTVTVSATAPTGSDTLRARVAYEDVNSGVDSSASDAGVYAAWDVQSRSRLLVTAVRNSAGRVSQGQNNLAVEIDIENTGAVAAVVTTSDSVGLQFLNNNGNTVTLSTPFLPDTVSGLSTQTYTFTVDISPTAATGIDSMRGFVIGRNVRSGAVTSSTGSYGAGWQVQTLPSIVINSIFNTLSQVNSGQEDLLVEMRLRNAGGATAVIDSVGLFTTPSGFITDSLVAALDSLLGGLRDTVVFDVDVSALFTGSLDIDGFVRYRDGNDTTRAFVDSFAVNTHRWQVGTEGALVVDSVYTNVPTLSLGQSGVLVNAVVRNGGDAAVRVDSLRLTFDGLVNHPVMSGVRTSPVLPSVLNAGQSFVSSFNISAASAPRDSGYITLDMQAFGTDQITSVFVSTLGAAQTDSVLLQTPADVRVVSITNPASVTQGEDNILDTLIVRNFGTASAQVNNVLLDFQRGNTWYNRELLSPVTFPVMLAGGGVDTVIYEVDVLSSAPLGVDSLRGRVQYVELNRSLSVRDTSSYLSSWQVFGSGGINVLSVQSAFDSVSTGQDSIFVQVRVGNSGNNSVIVDSLRLAMIRGLYVDSTLILTPGTVLDSASTALYDFYVTIDSLSPTGIEILNARVYGRDSFDNSDVSDVNSDTTDTWLIQRAVTLAMIAVSPVEVSQGQVISPQVRLRNTGDARLVVDTSQTRLQVGGVPRSLTDVLLLAGNSLDTLVFATDSVLSAPGLYPYQLRVVGVENGSSYDRVFTLTDLLVESAGALVIDSLVASADTVTQSMDTLVTVYVSNTGEADVFVDSVTVSPYGEPLSLNPAIPFSLAGGSSQGFVSRVNIPALADTGQITMTARTQGRDANSGLTVLDTTESVSADWVVLSSPLIAVDSLYSDSVVVLGQSGILLNVRLVNSGQTPVEITSLTINDRIGLYAHRSPSLPVILGGNSSVTLVDTISVAANSATGSDTLTASVAFTNTISGDTQNFTSPTQWIWDVESSSNVRILSVTTTPERVSRGQTGISVRVNVQNQGDARARIDAAQLMFNSEQSSGYTYYNSTLVTPLPLFLDAGSAAIINYLVAVTDTAVTGLDSLDAQLNGQVVLSGLPVIVNTADTRDSWTVESRPNLVIDDITITPAIVSTGQTGVIARISTANLDTSGLPTATARISGVDLNFLINGGNADTNFVIVRQPNPVIPFNLPAGQDIVTSFNVNVDVTALDTLYEVDGYISYTDINDNSAYEILTAGTQSDTLIVQTAAGLSINEFTIAADTLSLGQDDVYATAVIQNFGASLITVNNATLSFSISDALFERFLQNRTTPFILPGYTTDTLLFNITIAEEQFLDNTDVTLTANVSGVDNNSQAAVSDNAFTTFFLQSPADPRWAGRTFPAVTDVGDTVQFRVSIRNEGTARIDLDSTQTFLILADVDTIPLSAASAQTITGNGDTTELIFREVIIPVVDPDDYAVLVQLGGISTGYPYSVTISAGQVTVGGDIFFAGGSVTQDEILRGDTDILATILVGNSGGSSLTIDSMVRRFSLYIG